MIIAYHVILTGYGHWLPNDPRGSTSEMTFTPELASIAQTHFGRRKKQPSREELKEFHRKAKAILAHPVLWFQDAHRSMIAEAIGAVVSDRKLTCYACAVLSCHVHLLIRRHRLRGQEMAMLFKDQVRSALHGAAAVPRNHPVFSADMRVLYKYDPPSVRACVKYIHGNFARHRIPPSNYDFVTPYDNWPFHRDLAYPG